MQVIGEAIADHRSAHQMFACFSVSPPLVVYFKLIRGVSVINAALQCPQLFRRSNAHGLLFVQTDRNGWVHTEYSETDKFSECAFCINLYKPIELF